MPAFASYVQCMTAGSASERGAGLDGLRSTLGDAGLPEESHLAIVREPGLLAALNPFLSGDRSLTALKVLFFLGRVFSPSAALCKSAVFDSECFPSVKAIAATGSTTELKQQAWAVIRSMAAGLGENHRTKEFIDSPGFVALLQSHLNTSDSGIAASTAFTINSLCRDKPNASAVLDNYPDLVQTLVNTFSTSGVGPKFNGKLQLTSLAPPPRLLNSLTTLFLPPQLDA